METRLLAKERLPGHVQRLIFGNDCVQVAQQREVFRFDYSTLGELGQSTSDDYDRCRTLQRDSRHSLTYLREGQACTHQSSRTHVAPTLARYVHIAHAGQPYRDLGLT